MPDAEPWEATMRFSNVGSETLRLSGLAQWRSLAWLATVCWLASVATAAAQRPTDYSSRTVWQAAAGPVNTITFEGLAPAGSFTAFDDSAGLPTQGVRFTGLTTSPLKYYLRVVDSAYSTGFNWGSGQVLHGPPERVGPNGEGGPTSLLLINLPAGITAIGVDLMSFRDYGSAFAIGVTTTSAQYTYTVTTPSYPGRQFFGVVSTENIVAVRLIGRTGFPTIDNFSFGGASALGSPVLTGSASGSTVSLSWTPAPVSAPVTGYVVEAARSSFGQAIASAPVAGTSLVAPNVPAGTYFVRVYGVSASVPRGPSSNEVVLNVGGVCSAAPSAPVGLSASGQGGNVVASWSPPSGGCAPTSYVIRAGSAPGAADIGSANLGLTTSLNVPVPPGSYYLTVVAMNGAAASGPSNEALAVVGGCTVPAAPTGFAATSALDVATLTWQAPAGAIARYRIEVGSSSGATDLASVPWPGTALQAAGVARGTYYLRVRAESACGVGPASSERVLVVSY